MDHVGLHLLPTNYSYKDTSPKEDHIPQVPGVNIHTMARRKYTQVFTLTSPRRTHVSLSFGPNTQFC